MQDHTICGCGFGYITFDTEQAVDDLLAKGSKVELAGAQVATKRMPKEQIPLPTLSKLQGDSGNAYDRFKDSYDGCDGDGFDNIGYRSSGSAPHWDGAAGHAGHDGVEFGGYRGFDSGMELNMEEAFVEYSGHHGRGRFGLYEEYGIGMKPYGGEPFFQYFDRHGGCEFGLFKCHGGAMAPYGGEPPFKYSYHFGGNEFCGGMEPYRGEPSEYFRHGECSQFGKYGGATVLYREEPFHEYSSHSRGGFFRCMEALVRFTENMVRVESAVMAIEVVLEVPSSETEVVTVVVQGVVVGIINMLARKVDTGKTIYTFANVAEEGCLRL